METPLENILKCRDIARALQRGDIDEAAARADWETLGVPSHYQDEMVLTAEGGGDVIEIENPKN